MAVVQRTVWGDVSAIQLHSLPRSRPQPEAILLEASYHIRESNCILYILADTPRNSGFWLLTQSDDAFF